MGIPQIYRLEQKKLLGFDSDKCFSSKSEKSILVSFAFEKEGL